MSSYPDGDWETVVCPLCPAGTSVSEYLTCGDRLKSPGLNNYQLLSCKGCGLIFLSPRPSFALTQSLHLQEGYDPFISFSASETLIDRIYIRAREWATRWKRRLVLRQIARDSRVLDVGCGTGEFLLGIRDVMKCQGLEPEPSAAEWGRTHHSLEITTGTLDSVAILPESFDMITMWHALEHMPDPLGSLQTASRLLAPGGKLLIALPNIDSYDAGYYGPEWVAIDAPRHLWHFTPETLTLIAARAGFKMKVQNVLPLDHFYNILLSEGIHLKIHPEHKFFSPIRLASALVGSLGQALFNSSGSGMYYILEK